MGLSIYKNSAGLELDVSVIYAVGSVSKTGDYTLFSAFGAAVKRGVISAYPFAESAGGDIYFLDNNGRVLRELHDEGRRDIVCFGFAEFIDGLH